MTRRTLTLAHSPDADDAFMFYGLAKNRLDTGELAFEHVLSDIQSLNRAAELGTYDITAISFAAYPRVSSRYALLSSGGSIGDGYGPVVVAREPMDAGRLSQITVAIPGPHTSAYVALELFSPKVKTVEMNFNEIQEAVRDGKVEAGLIIHEGQLTYQDEGLHKVVDLGEWWKEETGLPLPLGGNVIRRDLGEELIRRTSKILKESIQYSLDHREEALAYAMTFGRGLDTERADRFVGMYVNDFTLDYGEAGRAGIRTFLDRAAERGLVSKVDSFEFY